MKNTIIHPVYGAITYEESFWTGKKTVTIGISTLQKKQKNTYLWIHGDETTEVELRGNILNGVCLTVEGNEIWILAKPTWLDYLLSALPLVLILIWGNSTALCSIVPVVGGAIGGAIGGAAAILSMMKIRDKKIGGKFLTALLATAATFAICAALGFVLVFAVLSQM